MAYSAWLAVFGWSIFFFAFVTAIIMFASLRKFYPVMYLVSIATYVFTVVFVIDAFDLGRDGTLIGLAVSAVLFIGAGWYFSKKYRAKKEDFAASIPAKIKR